MKRICEIYDISKDYELPTGTVAKQINGQCNRKLNKQLSLETPCFRGFQAIFLCLFPTTQKLQDYHKISQNITTCHPK